MTEENNKNKKNKENQDSQNDQSLNYDKMVETSKKFKLLKYRCQAATRTSLTGITNLVVNFEDPCLVDNFLMSTFETKELYKETYNMDAIELQKGAPGRGLSAAYIDALIYGSCEMETDKLGVSSPKTDPQTGERKRQMDGFVHRKEIARGNFKDKLLVIKNIDYCMDFCQIAPGTVDARNLWIFDSFRNPIKKMGCRLLLITNVPLKLPFKVRTVKFEPVDTHEAKNIIRSFINLYNSKGYTMDISETYENQIIRKLCGLTYTEAADAFAEALSNNKNEDAKNKQINMFNVVKNLREKINKNFMEDANGLTHLVARPWQDYICPQSSNFTFDVQKIVRDFSEINFLKDEERKNPSNEKISNITKNIDAIRSRMPHVIILYGKGGVGKSAFPIHFAGLLDFDIWDFNVNASHSKWVGEGSERMRDALRKMSKSSHVIIRIDEYDRAMGSTEASGSAMHEAHKQVESEFMNWLQNSQEDGLFIKNDIFLILTTNHKENITGPLLRSGRADLVIDISDFDDKSMKETFLSASRRMKNRGVVVPLGFDTFEDFAVAISKLDIDKLIPLAAQKGFTVRDVDTLLIEMAAHNYYYNKNGNGIPWNTEMFIKVLEVSSGSTKEHDTGELILGDRFLMKKEENKENSQKEFLFANDYTSKFDMQKFISVDFLKNR